MLKWLQWITNRNWHVAYWIVPLPDLEQPSVISVGTAEKHCLCTRCVSCFVIPECLDWYNIIEILTDVEGNGKIYYQGRRPRAIIWKPRANNSPLPSNISLYLFCYMISRNVCFKCPVLHFQQDQQFTQHTRFI